MIKSFSSGGDRSGTNEVNNLTDSKTLHTITLVDAARVLTVLAALELLAVLLLQGQLGLQLGDASLGHLPAQLLVFLDQHSTLGHQFLPRLAARETSLTSRSEPGDKHNRQRDALDMFQLLDPQAKAQYELTNLALPK